MIVVRAPRTASTRLAHLIAVLEERAESGREPLGIDEVDEVPVAHPLFDLHIRHAAEPLAFAVSAVRPNTARHGLWMSDALPSIHACSSAGSVFRT